MENRVPGPGLRVGLRGRSSACSVLDGLVGDVRRGQSRSLVLQGEAGIGKTALLEYLLESSSELKVHGLLDGDARDLLSSAVGFKLDERVRERIVAETHGNPLALLELPRGLTATQLAGGFGVWGGQALSGRIEENFIGRLETLS